MVRLRPLEYVHDRVVPPLCEALQAELDGAPAVGCVLGPRPAAPGGQWLGAPVAGLDDLAAAVFAATEGLVPVTHPQPFPADVVLARRVARELAGRPVSASWTATSLLLVADRWSPRAAHYQDILVLRLGYRAAW